ncbi:MAG: hypothetical protein ABIR96_12655 [Bdellovibrionota bacterium]
MNTKISKLILLAAILSGAAQAASTEQSSVRIDSQVYAEQPCNFYYATRGAFRISVDVASLETQLGKAITDVEVVYGYFGRWTNAYQLNKNPRRVEMTRVDASSRFEISITDDFLAKKGEFQHDAIDFLFHAQLEDGSTVDIAGPGYAEFFTAKIPYATAKCAFEADVWDALDVSIAGPHDRP